MPQIFAPRANAITKSILVGLAVVLVLGALLVESLTLLPYVTLEGMVPKGTWVGLTPDQPVPFSHKHHAGSLGLDCRYCHTTTEDSWFAGLPPTHTCMTCHSQFLDQAPMLAPLRHSLASGTPLKWSRVNNLPDYVYFDHSIHVAKGVGCETCHGRIDKMPLTRVENPFTMEFCLDCHRDPRPYLRPTDRVFTMGWRPQRDARALGRELLRANRVDTAHLTDCYTCHR